MTILSAHKTVEEIQLLPFAEQLDWVNRLQIPEPVQLRVPLDAALTDKEFNIPGNFFTIIDASDVSAAAYVKFQATSSYANPAQRGIKYRKPFTRVFITAAAQAGKWIDVYFAQFAGSLFDMQDFRLATQISQITLLGSISGSIAGLTGALPAGAVEVKGRGISANAGAALTTVYTVTALKTLYMAQASLGYTNGASNGCAELIITDAADVFQSSIMGAVASAHGAQGQVTSFLPQITVPAGYKIKIRKRTIGDVDSTDGNLLATFRAWEI